jgi:hypothetical protein
MATVHYPSAPTAEIIDVEFVTPTGASRVVRLPLTADLHVVPG